MLEFVKDDKSGNLKSYGIKGQYWLMCEAWTYAVLINTDDPAGPMIEKFGAFNDEEDAISHLRKFDLKTEEDE